MEIAVVGLGKMGANIARRLMRGGHRVVAHDREPALVEALVAEGAQGAATLADTVAALHVPRAVWLMLPSGAPTREVLAELVQRLASGDAVVDGGNTDWREDETRAEVFGRVGIAYLDAGVAGGVHGLTDGYCMMVGGEKPAVERLRHVFDTLSAPQGFAHVGRSGAGHYAKMVHNAIQYGMMQSLAEGFELLRGSPHGIDLPQIASLWRHGSMVRSFLLDMTHATLRKDAQLENVAGYVSDTGEGRWAVETAIAQEAPLTVLAASLFARFRSRQPESYAMKLQAAIRSEYRGEPPPPAPPKPPA